MKNLKYLFVLCLILGNYQFVFGMQMPKITEKNSAQLPYIEKYNKESIDSIDFILGKRERLEKEDLNEVNSRFSKMKDNTPSKSKRKVATRYIQKIQSVDFSNEVIDEIQKNNQILHAYSSPTKSALVSIFSNVYSSPEVRRYSAVNINHVISGSVTRAHDKIVSISGRHSFQEYLNDNSIEVGDLLLIASDNKTIGFDFGNEINKTLYVGLTASIVLENLKDSETLAKSPHDIRFKVSLVNNDRYVGSYQDSNNQCLYPTIFPVFVVNEKNKNALGEIHVGKFARLNSEIVNEEGELNLSETKMLYISPFNFNQAMHIVDEKGEIINHAKKNDPKRFKSNTGHIIFADITDELNIIFAQDLVNLGLSAFPVSIYGIIDNREIK